MIFDLLAPATTSTPNAAPARLDPLELFLQADIVVQLVMAGLIIASIWTWAIIVSFSLRMRTVQNACDEFETAFWETKDLDGFMKDSGSDDVPAARIAGAALAEWRRSTRGGVADKAGLRDRLAGVMDGQIAEEADTLADRLGFLATVGAVAPFVGLFGTVWGIMNSFFQIGEQENTSLAVVAPGISEALFATAIGLFAAIPAVIAYNRFSQRVNGLEAHLHRFADRFHASLSRQLERM